MPDDYNPIQMLAEHWESMGVGHPVDAAAVTRAVVDGRSRIMVGDGGVIALLASPDSCQKLWGYRVTWLNLLWVPPESRRMGYGTGMVKSLIRDNGPLFVECVGDSRLRFFKSCATDTFNAGSEPPVHRLILSQSTDRL